MNSSRREIKKLLTDLLRYLFSTLLAITLKMPGTGILSVITDFVNKSLQVFWAHHQAAETAPVTCDSFQRTQYLLQCRCFSPLEGMVTGEW